MKYPIIALQMFLLLSVLTSPGGRPADSDEPGERAPYRFRFTFEPGPEERRLALVDLEIHEPTGRVERAMLRCEWGTEGTFVWCSRDRMTCYSATMAVDSGGDTASWTGVVHRDGEPVASQEVSVRLRER